MQTAYCNTQPFTFQTALTSAAEVIALDKLPQPIPGYNGYTITECGKVHSHGKLLQQVVAPNRCPRIRLSINGKKSKIAVARLVAITFVTNPDNHRHYIHKDHDLNNYHASNLQWVTDREYNHFKTNKRLAANGETPYDYKELLGPVKRSKEKPVIDLGGVPVNDFPGYFITREGVVYKTDKIIPPQKGNRGNSRIRLRYPTVERKYLKAGLATLVAEHFVPNPNKYKHVIFKDRNNRNCRADNLAWVDGETFMYWSGATSKASNEKKKKRFTREEAIARCNDPWLLRYYESLNETYLQELWAEIDKEFIARNLRQWPELRSECYMYFRDRLERFSLFYNPVPTLVLYMRTLREKLKQEISTPLPTKRMWETDETLRSRTYRSGDKSGNWMWEGMQRL